MGVLEGLAANGKQRKIGKGQHAAAMHGPAAIHVLGRSPKGAEHRAVILNAEKERTGHVLERVVARPGLPSGKLTLGHQARPMAQFVDSTVHGFAPECVTI